MPAPSVEPVRDAVARLVGERDEPIERPGAEFGRRAILERDAGAEPRRPPRGL